MVAMLSGSAFGALVLTDAQWMSGTVHAEASVTDIPGDPGLLIQVNKTASGGIDAIRRDFGGADLSASGTTFEIELENPGTVGYNIQAFAQSGGWTWAAEWAWLGAGATRTYVVTMTNPASVNRVGIQLHADAGQYTIKIKGGIVDFSPSDPNPKDGGTAGVILGGNRLTWINHSIADPVAGSDVVSELFISSDANDVFNDPTATKISGLTNFAVVELIAGEHYRWGVRSTEPDEVTVYQSPIWSFDAITRIPSTKYEAEYSTIIPGDTAPERRNVAAASGGKIIWSNWSGTDRGSFVWDVMAPAAGTYNLTIHYAIDGTSSRGEKVQVNGVPGGDTTFPGTSGAFADLVVPVTLVQGLNTLGIVTSWGGISYDYFELNMDDLTATLPSPANNEVVLVGDNKLAWRKHSLFDPQNASDTTCTVYMGTTEPNGLLPHYGYTAIATDIAANTIPVTLDWGQNYYWVVDSTAVVDSNSVVFPGYLWRFTTVDPAPVITLATSKTVRRTVPFWLKPTVTDLGKPGLAYAWSLTSGPEGVAIDDVCEDPSALNPKFTCNTVGAHTLTLTVTDGSDNAPSANIEINVIEYYRALRAEAEDGTIIPGDTEPQIRVDDNASGNRLVWTNWSGTDRGSLVIDVNSPVAGTFDMIIRYRVDGTGTRGDKIQINGSPAAPADTMFPGTNAIFDDYVYKNVMLNQGDNQIKITTSWGGMSYDYIEFPAIKAPLAAYDPAPETWSTVPSTLQDLGWRIDPNSANSAIDATVFLGTTPPDFEAPDYGMDRNTADTATSFFVGDAEFAQDTTYYWLVEYTDSELPDQTFRSATWRFTTVNPCVYYPLVGDLDQDCDVDIDDLQILAASWMAAENGYLLENFADLAAHWLLCMDPVTGIPGSCFPQ